ncbi:hypothetical protein DNX69_00125 [Rhodopseudomonas palustris]|uniref:Short-chain dehydrogenase/reductase SDR n=1 Tax=Rhodopseudomonas palustris TaxID=1076 RepID=A0A323UN41_RHOPL|nr:hypothetical protein DNX69_00125 [Rhodopseudomonas palustris]
MPESGSLAGKVAIVTGAARGIGRAAASPRRRERLGAEAAAEQSICLSGCPALTPPASGRRRRGCSAR